MVITMIVLWRTCPFFRRICPTFYALIHNLQGNTVDAIQKLQCLNLIELSSNQNVCRKNVCRKVLSDIYIEIYCLFRQLNDYYKLCVNKHPKTLYKLISLNRLLQHIVCCCLFILDVILSIRDNASLIKLTR